jgi:hypothetical protein
MNTELLTRKIKKIGQEISNLAQDIEHNKSRKQFFIDLIKLKTYELYDLCKELQNEPISTSSQEPANQFLKKNAPRELFRTELDALKEEHQEQISTPTTIETPPAIEPVEDSNPLFALLPTDNDSIPSLPNTTQHSEIPSSEEIVASETNEEIVEEHLFTPKHTETPPSEAIEEEKPIVNTTIADEAIPNSFYLQDLLQEFISKKSNSNDISNRLQNTPILNFTTALSISQKHLFINELFGNNPETFKETLTAMENLGDLTKSLWYLENEIAYSFQWDKKEKSVIEFLSLVRRRFLKP